MFHYVLPGDTGGGALVQGILQLTFFQNFWCYFFFNMGHVTESETESKTETESETELETESETESERAF